MSASFYELLLLKIARWLAVNDLLIFLFFSFFSPLTRLWSDLIKPVAASEVRRMHMSCSAPSSKLRKSEAPIMLLL